MRQNSSAVAFTIALAVAWATTSCSSETGPRQDPRLCPVSEGEFPYFGCVAIAGRVVGARGQPLAGIQIGLRQSLDAGMFNGAYAGTDTAGRFVLRPVLVAPPPRASTPDSVSLWVEAVVVPQLPQMVATVFDSALVRAKVAAAGSVPDTVRVAIALPVP